MKTFDNPRYHHNGRLITHEIDYQPVGCLIPTESNKVQTMQERITVFREYLLSKITQIIIAKNTSISTMRERPEYSVYMDIYVHASCCTYL
jgi:hypothetical protein